MVKIVEDDLSFYCPQCNAPRPENVCWKCASECRVPHPEWTNPKLPPIERIRELAKACGYAIGVHGSMQRDLDLIAVPWSHSVTDIDRLLSVICEGINARVIGPKEKKPHGRLAVIMQINGWFKPIDLSIIPPLESL